MMLWLALVVAAANAPVAPAVCPDAPDVQLLQSLRLRRMDLDAREAELNERTATLNAIRKQMDDDLRKMSDQISALEARLQVGEAARAMREKRVVTLVEALQSLSAKKAAPMLASADPDIVSDLLLRMGATRTAALLQLMPPAKAAQLIEQVSGEEKRRATAKATP